MYFGEYLIKNTIITPEQLAEGLHLQTQLKKPIGETLVHMGIIDKASLDKHLESHMLSCADKIANDPEFKDVSSNPV